MTCANCRKEIASATPVTEDGYFFCTPICRYDWRSKGKPTPFADHRVHPNPEKLSDAHNEFAIDPPGFENRNMKVRVSYWTPPKLFLDGEQLRHATSGLLGTNRTYTAVSNFGKPVTLRIRGKGLDHVPDLEIDGERFLLARPLNRWEFAWMALPVILIFLGTGALGGLIAGAAIFSNSVLMRRIGPWLPRYVLTGATTVMSFLLFFNSMNLIQSYLPNFRPSPLTDTVEQQLVMLAREYNKRGATMIDKETRIDSMSAGPGKMLTYHYTMVNYAMEEVDPDKAKEAIRPPAIAHIRSSEEMKALKDAGVLFTYKYADKNGRAAFEFTVTPAEYK
jgi:hypothetical protein